MIKILITVIAATLITACNSEDVSSIKQFPMLIAHRGMIPYPKNSLVSFEHAIKYTQYIEMDIRFTSDNIPVIIHDKTLDRTTSCNGMVSDKNWDEISQCLLRKRLDWNYTKYTLSSLNEILSSEPLRKGASKIFVEIKEFKPDAIDDFLSLIAKRRNILIESYDKDALEYIHTKNPDVKLYLISQDLPEYIPNYISGVLLHAKYVNNATKEESGNLEVYVWTVDTQDDFYKYCNMNVDGILTNDVRYFSKSL